MPDQEPLTYTVTPGPEILKKMGLSWTLFGPTGAQLTTFSHGPDGEPPGPVDLTLSKEQAAELAATGYEVRAAGDTGPGIDPLGGTGPEKAIQPMPPDVIEGRQEEMAGEPGQGVQVEPGTQADGSLAEPVKRRKN